MVNESFWWQSGNLYLSRDYVKNMKKNMRKVPIIQKKSDLYHNKEKIEAENILDKVDGVSDETIENSLNENRNAESKSNIWSKIVNKIKTLLKI